MYKSILIPIDLANVERSQPMIEVARKLGDEGSQIILLNVVEEVPTWIANELPEGILEKSSQSARSELKALAKAAVIKVEVEIRSGHPYKTILHVADEAGTDLIIIASHKPGLQDYFLGSTAARVVRHAKCTVLVVR
jgi:nucleotide-binding universal stress UspA family protein